MMTTFRTADAPKPRMFKENKCGSCTTRVSIIYINNKKFYHREANIIRRRKNTYKHANIQYV